MIIRKKNNSLEMIQDDIVLVNTPSTAKVNELNEAFIQREARGYSYTGKEIK
jgi:hypothetical protein